MVEYSGEFYEKYEIGVRQSAEIVVPMILELLAPRSAVDIGCGTGGWLAEFRARGVDDVLGLDGSWVPVERLKIPQTCFAGIDLLAPATIGRTFDVALCLEVAEHVNEAGAKRLIEFLTSTSPFVVFSAAVPGQGGKGHVNEQWLDYWQDLFQSHGYTLFDPIRAAVWDNPLVEPWYAQNIVVFGGLSADPDRLERLRTAHRLHAIPVKAVHPMLRTAIYE